MGYEMLKSQKYNQIFLPLRLLAVLMAIFLASCGATTSGLTSSSDIEDLETNLDDTPISIPVTTAKLEGVDASTLRLVETGDTEEISRTGLLNKYLKYASGLFKVSTAHADSNVIGTLMGSLHNSTGTLGIVIDGSLTHTLDVTDSDFEIDITEDDLDTSIALLVLEDGADVKDGSWSAPVIVTVTYDELLGGYRLIVHITNTSADVTNDTAADIQNTQLAVSPDSQVAFSAIDSVDNSFVGTVAIKGGRNSKIADTDELLDQLLFDADGFLYGIETDSKIIKSIDEDSNIETVGDEIKIPDERFFKLHPTEMYAATNSVITNPTTSEDSITLSLIEMNDPDILTVIPIPVTEAENVLSMTAEWINSSSIILFKEFATGYVAEAYEVSSILDGIKTTFDPPLFSFSSTKFIGNPISDYGSTDEIYYECENVTSGVINVCSYAPAIDTVSTVITVFSRLSP